MPDGSKIQKPPIAVLLGMMCVVIAVAPLNIYMMVKHLGAPPVWSAAVLLASIFVCVAAGLLIWIRLAGRR